MRIFLHNPGHNGDILHSLGIVSIIIKSNPSYKFVLVPACSSFLYTDLLNERVAIEEHPVIWNTQMKNSMLDTSNVISQLHHIIYAKYNDDIYVNIWKLLTDENKNCISLTNRGEYCKRVFYNMNVQLGVNLEFNYNGPDIIPELPRTDVTGIISKLKSYKKNIVLFYNLNSFSGFEYTKQTNDEIIDELITKYNSQDNMLLLVKQNDKHNELLTLERDFNIIPSANGKNLIDIAYIANECNHVYFKINGGSLFILNKMNISRSNIVNYHLKADKEWQDVVQNEYGMRLCD